MRNGLAIILGLIGCVCICPLGQPYARAQFGFNVQRQQDIMSMYLFNGQDEATYKRTLEQRCQLQLSQVSEIVELDEARRDKLGLAIQGDLNRFYRAMALVREQTKGLNAQDQNDMQKAWQAISPLQQQLSKGLVSEGSLFLKVLESCLSEEQSAVYAEYLQVRARAQAEAICRITISDLEKTVPMLAKQREDLLRAMLELDVPKTIPKGYQTYLGFVYLCRLDKTKLDAIFDRSQVKTLVQVQKQFEGYKRAIQW